MWDIALGITVKDIYEYYGVWEHLLQKYLHNIADHQASIYSPIYHYSKSYLIGEEDRSKVRILGGKEKADHDEIDLNLLIELSKHARMSLVELSQKIRQSAESL